MSRSGSSDRASGRCGRRTVACHRRDDRPRLPDRTSRQVLADLSSSTQTPSATTGGRGNQRQCRCGHGLHEDLRLAMIHYPAAPCSVTSSASPLTRGASRRRPNPGRLSRWMARTLPGDGDAFAAAARAEAAGDPVAAASISMDRTLRADEMTSPRETAGAHQAARLITGYARTQLGSGPYIPEDDPPSPVRVRPGIRALPPWAAPQRSRAWPAGMMLRTLRLLRVPGRRAWVSPRGACGQGWHKPEHTLAGNPVDVRR